MVAFRTIKSVLNPVLAGESSQRQYVKEQVTEQIWPMGCSLLTSAIENKILA